MLGDILGGLTDAASAEASWPPSAVRNSWRGSGRKLRPEASPPAHSWPHRIRHMLD